jgi:N-acetylmuramic acid 6-phosphate etherase
MKKTTEADSLYNNLENLSTHELLTGINNEDAKVAEAIKKCIPAIEKLVDAIVAKMKEGGRLFYLGAGTSGRLGIVDASELPPTYGVEHGLVIGLIAGGDTAIRKAVEFAEDDENGGWKDLEPYKISKKDVVIGIAASGSTPYVIGTLKKCQQESIVTGCITCNENAPVIEYANFPVVAVVGPEFVTGSTRMKAGTAQKLILNMISTTTMIRLGRIKGNKMVDMQLSNNKLIDRGAKMIMDQTGIDYEMAKSLLEKHGSVRKAVDWYHSTQ